MGFRWRSSWCEMDGKSRVSNGSSHLVSAGGIHASGDRSDWLRAGSFLGEPVRSEACRRVVAVCQERYRPADSLPRQERRNRRWIGVRGEDDATSRTDADRHQNHRRRVGVSQGLDAIGMVMPHRYRDQRKWTGTPQRLATIARTDPGTNTANWSTSDTWRNWKGSRSTVPRLPTPGWCTSRI